MYVLNKKLPHVNYIMNTWNNSNDFNNIVYQIMCIDEKNYVWW
jgi:hypothetical protein